jgi:Formate hydrogenlyase subunit 3/Multisubunit Na+/H+ antiporter, MnhD subunit
MNSVTLLDLTIVLPLVGALLIVLAGRHPNLREAVTLTTAVALLVVVALIVRAVVAGERPEEELIGFLPGATIALAAEPLGCLFALIAGILWLVTSVYSIGYMRGHHEKNQTRFFAFFAIAIAGAMGVAFSANLVTLFVFYEALTLSTFPLVGHAGTPEARRGARTYAGILLAASFALLLPAIVVTGQVAGTYDFAPGGILNGKISATGATILLALFVFGIAKAAVMPLHRWLPAAMVAPTPVSALLHAVAVVKAGVFAIVKVTVYVFGVDLLQAAGTSRWMVVVCGFTILAASIAALQQDNLKRRLAYSTVSQLSYVVLGAAILAPLSLVGAGLHIAAHAFAKITLFFAAGSILVASHKTEVSQLDGIGRRMPWTMAAFSIAALSMIGLPPTAGFVSKWFILGGAFQADNTLAVLVIILSTLLNAGYFLPIVYAAFFKPPAAAAAHAGGHHVLHDHGEAPLTVVAALLFTAAGTIALFFSPSIFLDLSQRMLAP